MKKIIIFAPVDGKIQPIFDVKDDVFSNGFLGEGFFIEPTSEYIFSPLDNGKAALVFDTKHAFYIQQDKIKILVHIGLETVGLNGKPFSEVVVQGSKVTKDTILAKVDLKYLRESKIDNSVIVAFDPEIAKEYKFVLEKAEEAVSKGDPIGYLEFSEEAIINQNESKSKEEIKDKWNNLSSSILQQVGGNTNFESYYNCMTRLRFKIIDKSKVNEKDIKKNNIVKGIKWNGQELQIIIGGDAYKAKDQLDFILKGNKVKPKVSSGKKVMSFISGVMVPALPVLMATGILAGLQALFLQLGWVKNPSSGVPETQLDLFSMIMFIGSKVGLELIGVVFCYNTVKYLGGNPIMGIFLGMALTSRHIIGPGFGADAGFLEHNGKGYFLFSMFGESIYIKGYESSIIPLITGGIFLFYFDKFVKRWMPGAVDIVFRPALVFITSFVLTLFLIGPITGIIEQFLGQGVVELGSLPGGIGVGVTAGLWQLLVVTGTHVAVANAVKLPIMTGGSSAMAAMFGIAILAQFGALIGVTLRTKNQKLKQAAVGAMPSIIFGISEPTIYGVNLPKVRPFFAGCIGAFFGGILSGILGLTADVIGAGGFLQIMWFTSSPTEAGLYALCLLVAIAIGAIITFLIYKERPSEKTEINKIKRMVMMYCSSRNLITKKQFNENYKNDFYKISKIFFDNKAIYKSFEKLIWSKISIESKLRKIIENSEEKLKQISQKIETKNKSLIIKNEKLKTLLENQDNKKVKIENQISIIYLKVDNLNNQILKLDKNSKQEELNKLLDSKNNEIKLLETTIDKLEKEALVYSTDILEKISNNLNVSLNIFMDNLYNAINSVYIAYEQKEPKDIKTNKKIIYNNQLPIKILLKK